MSTVLEFELSVALHKGNSIPKECPSMLIGRSGVMSGQEDGVKTIIPEDYLHVLPVGYMMAKRGVPSNAVYTGAWASPWGFGAWASPPAMYSNTDSFSSVVREEESVDEPYFVPSSFNGCVHGDRNLGRVLTMEERKIGT